MGLYVGIWVRLKEILVDWNSIVAHNEFGLGFDCMFRRVDGRFTKLFQVLVLPSPS